MPALVHPQGEVYLGGVSLGSHFLRFLEGSSGTTRDRWLLSGVGLVLAFFNKAP